MAGPDGIPQALGEAVNSGLTWSKAAAFSSQQVADLLGLASKGGEGDKPVVRGDF